MKKTLLRQIYPSYILLVVACLGALGFVADTTIRGNVIESSRQELSGLLDVTEKLYYPETAAGAELPADIDQRFDQLFASSRVRLTLIDPSGRVLADSAASASSLENHALRPEVQAALKGKILSDTRFSASLGMNFLYLAHPVVRSGQVIAVLRASTPLTVVEKRISRLTLRILLGALCILPLAALLALFAVRRINRPLVELSTAAGQFGKGELRHRVTVREPVEIENLARAFNTMAEELNQKIDDVDRRRREAEAILAGMAEGVIVLDRDLIVREANRAAEAMLPSTREPIGKPLLEAFRATELRRYAERAIASGESIEGTLTIFRETPLYLQVYASRIEGREGCLIVLHDITRLIQLENVRKDFVANVSHELKTPVTSIKGFIETLSEGALEDPERAKRYLGIIAKHSERLEAIIEDLLSLARLEQQDGLPFETETVPLALIIEDARLLCSHRAESGSIPLEIDCPADIEVPANANLLEQAFVNLIDNAIKYSKPGFPVRIVAGREAGKAVIRVIDHGVGIPRKDLTRIFERFYRVDKARSREVGGTGLGLSIVKHIVSLHGGSVSAESVEAGTSASGSTFTVTIPVAGTSA